MGNENINLNFPQLENNLVINFKAPLLVSQIPTETEIKPVIDVEDKPEQQFQILDSFERYNIETDPNKFPWNSQNLAKIINPTNTDWNKFEVIPASEELNNFTAKTLDERLNDLKNLQPLEITSETSISDIQNYKKLLENAQSTVEEGVLKHGRLGANSNLLSANSNLLQLRADYNKQLENLAKQPEISDERKAELNDLSLNSRNNSKKTNSTDLINSNTGLTENRQDTWFSNQSDRSIYTSIVTIGKEAKITSNHKDQLAVAAIIENRGESSRWNPGGKKNAEQIVRAPNQFVAINGLGAVNNEEDAVKALAKKFGSKEAAREYVQYMYQTLKNGSGEYSEVQDWLGSRDSFRSANSYNYKGTPLIAGGNRYGW